MGVDSGQLQGERDFRRGNWDGPVERILGGENWAVTRRGFVGGRVKGVGDMGENV